MSAPTTEARRRHPCMRAPVPAARVLARVTDELELRDAPHADVGAAIISVRGASGLDRSGFAARAGVEPEVLRRAEAGEIARDQLPGSLRRMVPR